MITMTPSILIVDDHPSFRATARAILEADGFEVVGDYTFRGGGPTLQLMWRKPRDR